jgi:hypothetical protein
MPMQAFVFVFFFIVSHYFSQITFEILIFLSPPLE